MDAFTQHDVQELNRILSDRLEKKMKVILPFACPPRASSLPPVFLQLCPGSVLVAQKHVDIVTVCF